MTPLVGDLPYRHAALVKHGRHRLPGRVRGEPAEHLSAHLLDIATPKARPVVVGQPGSVDLLSGPAQHHGGRAAEVWVGGGLEEPGSKVGRPGPQDDQVSDVRSHPPSAWRDQSNVA